MGFSTFTTGSKTLREKLGEDKRAKDKPPALTKSLLVRLMAHLPMI
jgi:hypothetical protein